MFFNRLMFCFGEDALIRVPCSVRMGRYTPIWASPVPLQQGLAVPATISVSQSFIETCLLKDILSRSRVEVG